MRAFTTGLSHRLVITLITLTSQQITGFNFLSQTYRSIGAIFPGSSSFQTHPRGVNLSKFFSTSDDSFFDGYDDFIENLERDSEYDNVRGYDGDSRQSRGGRDSHRDRYNDRRPKKRSGGSGGHRKGYIRDPNDDMSVIVDENLVNDLIKKRSQAQFERNYDLADKIRDDLNKVYGIYVWDKDGLWTTSSQGPKSNQKTTRKFGRHGHDYIQIGAGINHDECPLGLDEIHRLLAERLELKLEKKYLQADRIQSLLYENGVRVHDQLRQWRADGNVFQDVEGFISGKKYTIGEYSDAVDESISGDIQNLVEAWGHSKVDRDYDTADKIRDELWGKYRVAVDDKSRTWSAGGDFGPNGTFRWTDDGPINPRVGVDPTLSKDWRKFGTYSQSASSEKLEDPDVKEEVANLVHDRLEAKRVRDYTVADEIRDHLYEVYNISVDDKLRQWSVGGDFGVDSRNIRATSPTAPDGKTQSSFVRVYNHYGGYGKLSKADIALVEALVQRFAEERARYNTQAARSIVIGLKKKFSVVIDDLNGEWYVQGNNYMLPKQYTGTIPVVIDNAREEIEEIMRERSQAIENKDFEHADKIRSHLIEKYRIKVSDRLNEWTILKDDETVNDNRSFENDASSLEFEKDESKEDSANTYFMSDSDKGKDEVIFGCKDRSKFIYDKEALFGMNVLQLKEKLRKEGLRVSGRKSELIQRILDSQK